MLNGIHQDLQTKQIRLTTDDVTSIQRIFDSYHSSNSLEDEVSEFFREVAALKGQSVDDTLQEMIAGTRKYIEAVNTPIELKNDLPVDINTFAEKLQKLSEGIEICWDIFSEESKQSFINLAKDFCLSYEKFQGWKSLLIRAKLFLPSIQQKQNLYRKYKDAFLLIPKAVKRAVDIRQGKSTFQLQQTAQSILKRAKNIELPKLLPIPSKYLGRSPEEQIEKNKPARAWAKARLEEIENKRNGKNL